MEIQIASGETFLIDEEDVHLLTGMTWYISRGYVRPIIPYKNGSASSLHRMIMNASPGQVVDHINGNTLDNRRDNLRIASSAINSWNTKKYSTNTSGYKGVSFDKGKKRWRAAIGVDNRKIILGYFRTPELAYEAYKAAALVYHKGYNRVSQ